MTYTTNRQINVRTIRKLKNGIWLENGIYYVDCSERVSTKKEAMRLGTEKAQISIYGWSKNTLVYL